MGVLDLDAERCADTVAAIKAAGGMAMALGADVSNREQTFAAVAQLPEGREEAVVVVRVQADARLVEHEHGVDEGRAQRGGQVDALHFAAAQGAALAVECEVADAHVAQVFEAGGDFFEQQLQGFLFGAFALSWFFGVWVCLSGFFGGSVCIRAGGGLLMRRGYAKIVARPPL